MRSAANFMKVYIVGDNAGGAWHGLERTRNVHLAPRMQRIFVCTWNSAWNRHGTVHGMRMEWRTWNTGEYRNLCISRELSSIVQIIKFLIHSHFPKHITFVGHGSDGSTHFSNNFVICIWEYDGIAYNQSHCQLLRVRSLLEPWHRLGSGDAVFRQYKIALGNNA